jgi:hypothetical protein
MRHGGDAVLPNALLKSWVPIVILTVFEHHGILFGRTVKGDRPILGSPEVQQPRKEYDHAQQARGQHIANIVPGDACASLRSGFCCWSLGVMLGH